MTGWIRLSLATSIVLFGLVGCERGRSPGGGGSGSSPTGAAVDAGRPVLPTVRLVLITDLAGALGPCGCVKDQLGGLDHFATWMQAERPRAPASLVAAAGPLFFMDAKLPRDRADQDRQKAAVIASLLHELHFAAFAPGVNDWADGQKGLIDLAHKAGCTILASSSAGFAPPFASAIVKDAGGIKVGFVGFGQGAPQAADAAADAPGPQESIARGVDLAKQQGASVLVALAAVGRDEAKRIAEAVPDLTAIVVGSAQTVGEENTVVPQAEAVGGVIVAQGGNHLQSVAVLDLYVRDRVTPGQPIRFVDATGLERGPERADLAARIDRLHEKIAVWERERTLPGAEIQARKTELAELEAERLSLDIKPPPIQGNFFRYALKEIRPSLGTDPTIQGEIGTYYEIVNGQNRVALADRKPLPRAAGQAGYVGVAVCGRCHAPAVAMWKHTWHARAYGTLSSFGREFNLECVGCHVTGYGLPGGSTVTHVDKLQNVQCEVCHGPGSRHVADPTDEKAVIAKPEADRCLDCHHPPHVEEFDAVAKMKAILGPGHGAPEAPVAK